jgi:hypothetical protein
VLLALGADSLRPTAGPGGLVVGGVDGLGHAVVLAGLPDDWIPVVLAAAMDGHPHPEGQGGFPVMDGLAAVVGRWSAGTP